MNFKLKQKSNRRQVSRSPVAASGWGFQNKTRDSVLIFTFHIKITDKKVVEEV